MIINANIWIGRCGKDIKCFKWHANVKLKNANDGNCIDREERGISFTMHAVINNRRAARRDRGYMNI
jgi:hypothetical protein